MLTFVIQLIMLASFFVNCHYFVFTIGFLDRLQIKYVHINKNYTADIHSFLAEFIKLLETILFS
jgi:hypothetical protein